MTRVVAWRAAMRGVGMPPAPMRLRGARRVLAVAALALLGLDTARAQPLPCRDSSAVALLALNRTASQRAALRGLVDALAAHLGDSAILVWPGAPVIRGRRAILAALAAQAPSSLQLHWDVVQAECARDGTLVLLAATTALRPAESDAAMATGRLTAAWARDRDDGRWRLEVLAVTGAPSARAWRVADSAAIAWRLPVAALDDRDPYARADRAFAALATRIPVGDAFAAWAAADAALLTSELAPIARGPRGVRTSLVASGAASLAWRWWPVYARGAGGIGVTVGEAELRDTTAAGAPPFATAYITFWRTLSDGRLRFTADAGGPRGSR
ncbi:MAG: DUF4440 domain-containing protein [Gemmatimonadaceae bacterium]|nr:DUF4440 domain-containing protein [Gemmatimonadaceae bacterium]